MNPKKYPNYDPEEILKSLTSAAVEIYEEEKSLHKVADMLDLIQSRCASCLLQPRIVAQPMPTNLTQQIKSVN